MSRAIHAVPAPRHAATMATDDTARSLAAFLVFFTLAAFVALAPGPLAHGQTRPPATGDVGAAADAFSRAQQAELREAWAEAAQLYALADRIAPAPEALRSAAIAAQRAGMDATAATLAAELLTRDGSDRASREVAEQILRANERALGRVRVRCTLPCRVVVDGRLATAHAGVTHVVYARPGSHRLSVSFEGADPPDPATLTLAAAERVDLEFAPMPSTAATAHAARTRGDADGADGSRHRHGHASPFIFATALTLTAASGAVAVWSGTRVNDAHDAYDRSAPDAAERYARGRELERRTNALLGTTGALALGTVVAAAFTDWHGHAAATTVARRGHPVAAVSARGITLGWTGTIE